jgi:hypothetical protein
VKYNKYVTQYIAKQPTRTLEGWLKALLARPDLKDLLPQIRIELAIRSIHSPN